MSKKQDKSFAVPSLMIIPTKPNYFENNTDLGQHYATQTTDISGLLGFIRRWATSAGFHQNRHPRTDDPCDIAPNLASWDLEALKFHNPRKYEPSVFPSKTSKAKLFTVIKLRLLFGPVLTSNLGNVENQELFTHTAKEQENL